MRYNALFGAAALVAILGSTSAFAMPHTSYSQPLSALPPVASGLSDYVALTSPDAYPAIPEQRGQTDAAANNVGVSDSLHHH